ncbi:UDP-2,3-diacylglucosamine diphosphatase [Pseudomonas sp. F1_0610]|uniref:UDP-2,3-diacylglucosamine diphosphatase n=1 Tax=Pseudomonas sp. F1_0610 TaxID=3114284 RepID=UPI0039C354AA
MILLISDLHLHEERPDLTAAFFLFLQQRASQAQALYILGDFFEVWIGDDAMSQYQRSIALALAELAQKGVSIYIMHGNRDFLLGKEFCTLAQCSLLPDPYVTELAGHKVLLSHGDLLCTSDHEYQRMRRLLRNPLSLFILRHLPLSTRNKLAGNLRSQSKQRTRMKASQITDVTQSTVIQYMQQYAVTRLIHGHTHRPATHQIETAQGQLTRIVLGDWDKLGWCLEVNEKGFKQESFII